MNLIDIRQFFAEEIRAVANIQTDALATAFAKVPRLDGTLGLPSTLADYRDRPRQHRLIRAFAPHRGVDVNPVKPQ